MNKGKILIGGKEYHCKIKDGTRIVNDMPIDDFLKKLSFDEILCLAMLGEKVKNNKIKSGSAKAALIAIESIKNIQ